MAKNIQQYAGFTATNLQSRASNTCDMVVNGTGVDCTNITDTRIKNVLNTSTTAVSALCSSPNANIWSNFGPTEWKLTDTTLANRIKTPYTMGSFAGYNHNAIAPAVISVPLTFDYSRGDTLKTLGCTIRLREINWNAVTSATHIKWVIKDGTATIANTLTPFANDGDILPQNIFTDLNITGWNTDKTLTSSLYFSRSDAYELCLFPTSTPWNIAAKVEVLNPPVIQFVGGGYIYHVIGTVTVNSSTSVYNVSITSISLDAAHNLDYYNTGNISIVAKVYNASGVNVYNQTITASSSARTYTGTLNYALTWNYRVDFVVTNV